MCVGAQKEIPYNKEMSVVALTKLTNVFHQPYFHNSEAFRRCHRSCQMMDYYCQYLAECGQRGGGGEPLLLLLFPLSEVEGHFALTSITEPSGHILVPG